MSSDPNPPIINSTLKKIKVTDTNEDGEEDVWDWTGWEERCTHTDRENSRLRIHLPPGQASFMVSKFWFLILIHFPLYLILNYLFFPKAGETFHYLALSITTLANFT